MEPFIVSARKYRPQAFEDVVGQQAITQTLLNAIEHNHLAQALLFCGPRGVGKTTCARILAKKINQDGTEQQEEDFAFNIFELDAASNNSVDDIRNLIDQVRIPPQVGKYKVYIIDEVHMLSQAAFNAFLKTLEEPPKHAIFILATTEKRKIIPTILSRCQIFDFKRISVRDAAEYLQKIAQRQGIEAESEALHLIAQKADGAMRDALSIFDRVVSFAGSNLSLKAVAENLNVLDQDSYFETTDFLLKGDIPGVLVHFNDILSRGFEGHHFMGGLASHFRDLMVCKHESTLALLEVSETSAAKFREQAAKVSEDFLLKAIDVANQCDLNYKASRNHRLLVELTLMKLASLGVAAEKKNPNETGAWFSEDINLIPASTFRTSEIPARKGIPLPYMHKAVLIEQDPSPAIPSDSSDTNPALEIPEEQVEQEGKPEIPSLKPGIQSKVLSGGGRQRVSGLSLSSLKAKKAHREKLAELTPETDLPEDSFSEEAMKMYWADFVRKLEEEGRKLLASSLSTQQPILKDPHTISLELPNHTMKKEVEREQGELLIFLRRQLNNYQVSLQITVNEENAKQYAFTPAEKYQKLREKNPAIDLLRKEFDLEL